MLKQNAIIYPSVKAWSLLELVKNTIIYWLLSDLISNIPAVIYFQ